MSGIIHETVLKDIVDLIGDANDLMKNADKALGNDPKVFKSLTRNANNLILVFPVLCTKGISIETASMISKAIEKNCVSLLEMLFASVQITDTENLPEYISKFHRNISVGDKITVDDFISFTDAISNEAALESGSIKVTDRAVLDAFKEGMKNLGNIAKITLNENSLSDFVCNRTNVGYEAILEKTTHKPSNSNDLKLAAKRIAKAEKTAGEASRRSQETIRNTREIVKKSNEKIKDLEKEKAQFEKERDYYKSRITDYPDNGELIQKYWSDNDIKKANELMPTKVVVNFYSKDAGQKFVNGIIGVKCKLYPVESMEIIERIASKYADTNWVKEFIRATTGEISFWRDFVFALDKARVDAINSSRKGSSAKMFKVLERRATKNRLSKWKANRADSSPITTLIVSQEEVEYLKKNYSIDLENRNVATKLMEEYNFMGITIVDEPSEVASFIWDEGNDATYETLSFRNLERESDDKNYRKVINLMTKISR